MPLEPRQGAQGDRGHPEEEDVRDHEEAGVSAAPQHALGEHAVAGLEEDDEGLGPHEGIGDPIGLRRHVVEVHHRVADEENDAPGDQPQGHGQAGEGFSLGLRPGHVPLAQGVAGDDGGRLGHPLDHHRAALLHHRGDGLGGDEVFTQPPEDHAHGVVAQSQQPVGHQYGDADLDIIPHQIGAFHE